MAVGRIELFPTAVEIAALSCRFGEKLALDDVSLTVPDGCVFGLVGENGAGKTTLIKHVLGLLAAQAGSVRVFGRDPAADPVGVLAQIGYLSEDADLPGWMRVDELLRYVRAFYAGWDADYAERLRREFELNPSARVKDLSKGQRARTGLLVALAYRPRLLVLDEPSSGLDPVVRRDILGAIIRTIADEGRTVLFSSHLLDEVERVSDCVAMIKGGRVVFEGELDEIKESHHRVTLLFDGPRSRPPRMAGAIAWSGQGAEWTALWQGSGGDLQAVAEPLGARVVGRGPAMLDEIFVARVGARPFVAGGDLKRLTE
jgi:ABC-2 type transport system ATP-binding protein